MNAFVCNLQVLIYLWTRDAKMPVSEDTESYVRDQLKKIEDNHCLFSDTERALMAYKLAEEAVR